VRTARREVLAEVPAATVHELLSSENDETPGAARGSFSISPKIVAPTTIAPGRPFGKPRGDAGTS
jgi:hypothetical protein